MNTPISPPADSLSTPNRIAAKSDNSLTWLDMEITGLSPENNRTIEMAVVVTGSELNILAGGPVLVIHQSDELLDGMDVWNRGTHNRSGLTDKVKASTTIETEAEAGLLASLRKWAPKSKLPICGSSIYQDRRSMVRCMPELEEYSHYHNLDVSTLKGLCKRWQSAIAKGFTKHQRHVAFADIIESIKELHYYREHFIRDVPRTPDAETLASSVAP